MVNFFSRKKSHYNGFAKYNDEYSRHQTPSVPAQRTQSLSGASQAAMAALQMHSKPNSPPSGSVQAANRTGPRTNSFGNYKRANSMQSYTYTPKASYVAGPTGPMASNAQRSYSLRSHPRPQSRTNSLSGRTNSLSGRTNSLSGRNNSLSGPPNLRHDSRANSLSGSIRSAPRKHSFYRLSQFPEEQEDEFANFDYNNEEDVVVTTKTTKVVDASGRTKSITTETIRTLADGSNIIETKTTNVSRPSSRSNSLKNTPLNVHQASPNLRKIEEDLSDFDYTYLDDMRDNDVSGNTQGGNPQIQVNSGTSHAQMNSGTSQSGQLNAGSGGLQESANSELNSDNSQHNSVNSANSGNSQLNSQTPQLNYQPNPTNNLHVLESPARIRNVSPNNRANSLSSTQSGRRLKSILKNNSAAAFRVNEAPPVSNEVSPVRKDPYSSPRGLEASPVPKNKRLSSMTSGANSIKFLETVETIPYGEPDSKHLQREEMLKKEQMKQDNLDLYDKAMQVAMQKVYGTDAAAVPAPNSPTVPNSEELGHFARKKSEKKLKTDVKRSKVEAAGVSPNYVYENHHKEFSMHSMRNGGGEGQTSTRKERSKDEKRRLKDEEKRREQLVKEAEKEKSAEEKKKKKKSPFSIFKKNKRKGSVSEVSVLTQSSGPSDFSGQASISKGPEPKPELPEPELKAELPQAESKFELQEPEFLGSKPQTPELPGSTLSETKVAESKTTKSKTTESKATESEVDAVPEASGKSESLPVLKVPEDVSVSELDENDEFVDVPENLDPLDEAADKRFSTIPVMDHFKESKGAGSEPIESFSVVVSGQDGRPRVLSDTSITPTRVQSEIKAQPESSTTQAETNVQSVARSETGSEGNTTSKTAFVDASSGDLSTRPESEVLIANGDSPREALVVDGDYSRSAEGFETAEFVLPNQANEKSNESSKVELNNDSPNLALNNETSKVENLDLVSSPNDQAIYQDASDHASMEGFSSTGQKVKVKSGSIERGQEASNLKAPKESKKKESKESKKNDSKGSRFKRSIEKYFLTTYK